MKWGSFTFQLYLRVFKSAKTAGFLAGVNNNEGISQETGRALNAEGVTVLSWEGFTHFVEQVRHTLEATPPQYSGGDGGGDEWDEGVEYEE